MAIEKVIIQNFKKFKNPFEIKFNENINLLVGDNESGKSTILEAIHVALRVCMLVEILEISYQHIYLIEKQLRNTWHQWKMDSRLHLQK